MSKKAIEVQEKVDADLLAKERRSNHVAAVRAGTMKFFDSEKMLKEVTDKKEESYAQMLVEKNRYFKLMEKQKKSEPDHTNVSMYAKWMSSMACGAHSYTAEVARYLLESQKLEYKTLAGYMQDAFSLCNDCMVYALEAVQNSYREINAKLNATCATVRAEREAVPPELSSMAKQHQQEIVSLKAKVAMLERDLASLQRQVSLQNLSTQLRSRSGSLGTAARGRAPYSRAMSSRQPSPSQAMLDAEHHRIKSTFLYRGDLHGAITEAQKVAAWREGFPTGGVGEDVEHSSMCGSHIEFEQNSSASGIQLFHPEY